MNADFPPIVLFVGGQDASGDPYSVALKDAGFWVTTSDCLPHVLRDMDDLQPDIVIANVTARRQTDVEEALVRTLASKSQRTSVPLLLLEDAIDVGEMLARVDTMLAARQNVRSGAHRRVERRTMATERPQVGLEDPAALSSARPGGTTSLRSCPECGGPLEWVERASVAGREYDYYRWCAGGCGLYCFEATTGQCLKLA